MDKFSPTAVGNFASQFAQRTLASQRVAFELQFNLLQNSLINRFNTKVDDVNQTPLNTQRKITDLQKEAKALVSSLPALQEYRQGNNNNLGHLNSLFDEMSDLFATFNQDANVDASEVAAFEAQRDKVVQHVNNLYIFVHPDIYDGKVIQRLKENVDNISGLTVTAGLLTDNQAVVDSLTQFQTEISIGITVTQNTVSTTLDLEKKIEQEFSFVDASLLELTTEEQARRDQEIANMRVDLGNVLRAISLSFELNAGFADALQARLSDPRPQPGSVLNLFT